VAFESVPHVAPEHPEPDSDHVTPLFCVSFCDVAVNGWIPIPVCTLGLLGAIVTTMPTVAVTVIVALDVLVVSSTDVAVSVSVASAGTAAGAV